MLLALGSFILSFGLNAFVIPNHLAEGGLTGISVLLHYVSGLPLGLIYFIANLPLLLAGYLAFGRGFTLRTLAGIAVLSAALVLTRNFAYPMRDLLLASIYGGTAIGFGLGLIFRSEGSSGGVDIIAKYLKERRGVPMGDTYLAVDIFVLGVAALLLGADTALYSLIITFLAGRVVDYVQEGPRRAKAALIVTDRPDEIAGVITQRFERGATFLRGEGAYTGTAKKVVFSVLNRSELARLKEAVWEIDPRAFVIISDITEVLGEGFYPRPR